jgi:hypothetical protein
MRQGMQDVDGPADVQAFAQPARHRRPRVQAKALGVVSRSQGLCGIAWHRGSRRHLGQQPAVRASEAKLAIRVSIDLIALLVDGAVVAATEQGEVRQRGGASLGPVTDVMALADRHSAAGDAAAVVSMVQRPA